MAILWTASYDLIGSGDLTPQMAQPAQGNELPQMS